MAFRFVDALGFAGGFTLGMVQAGFELVGKREMKGGFGVANCEANRHLLGQAWRSEAVDATQWSVVDAEVVAGNPPCSGFSGMSAKHFRGANSPINHCMWAFAEYAARVRPLVAVFESVQLAFTRPDGLELMRALRQRLEERTGEQWTLYHVLHNAYSIGGVAHRRRYFWVVARVPFGIEWPTPGRLPVLDDAIGDLENLPQSWGSTLRTAPPSWWAAPRTRDDLLVDGHMSVSPPIVQRVVDLLSGAEWKPGDHLARVARRYYDAHGRLPDSWAASQAKVIEKDFALGFNTPVRWIADEPARVITGAGLCTALHPRLPRMFSHREVARVMGFPDTWLIEPLRNVPSLQATWGKGITVDCGRWIGGWIRAALEENPGSYTGVKIGDREHLIDVTNAWGQTVVQFDHTLRKFRKLLSGGTPIMTDPTAPELPVDETATPAVEGEATEATTPQTKSGSGRPRPQVTIDRDAKALEAITAATGSEGVPAGLTKDELASAIDVQPSEAYLSLWRLKRDNKVHKTHSGGAARWVAGTAPTTTEGAASDEPVAAEAPAVEEPIAL